mgnify:CR=1 FL=1
MKKKATHPMQPLVWDGKVIRFKGNAIVQRLIDQHRHLEGGPRKGESFADLNEIAGWRGIPQEDAEQFWQLMGYSVSGYGDLSFVRRTVVAKADRLADKMIKRRKKSV